MLADAVVARDQRAVAGDGLSNDDAIERIAGPSEGQSGVDDAGKRNVAYQQTDPRREPINDVSSRIGESADLSEEFDLEKDERGNPEFVVVDGLGGRITQKIESFSVQPDDGVGV